MLDLQVDGYYQGQEKELSEAQKIYFKAHECGRCNRFFKEYNKSEKSNKNYDNIYLSTVRNSSYRIDNSLAYVENPHERLIIQKEILECQRGKWYLEYFSESTYRRNLLNACKTFIRYIEYI